jgi:prolyl-tRNA editing enzyme YbaK/EbsC (Cys-tRNA(Pro) deacylase)
VAQRHSGYLIGGTSPFGTQGDAGVCRGKHPGAAETIYINGGRRGFLVGIAPQVLVEVLKAKPVHCALAD